MEHRWHARHRARMDVVLYQLGSPVATGRSRDIGIDGMFVEADVGALGLRPGSGLKLEVALQAEGGGPRHRVSAVVVHCQPGGAGVLFTRRGAGFERALDDLVKGGPSRGTSSSTLEQQAPSPDRAGP